MTKKPSVKECLSLYNGKVGATDPRSKEYGPAYAITNEDLYTIDTYMPTTCDKVLTVAASGDHPLFCKLFGAKDVTTFDITYHAKLIMDIKTAALQELNIGEYWDLLKGLYGARDILGVQNMDRVMTKLNPESKNYIQEINNQRIIPIFSNGCNIDSYMKHMFKPTEYKILQSMNLKPFPFIWSNITNLDSQLNDTYDLIHTSNIFDYLEFKEMTAVLNKMLARVNVGGCLFIGQQNSHTPEYLCKCVIEQSKDWRLLTQGRINVLQRVR